MFSLRFGNRLRKLRRDARGFTQRDLADRIGIEFGQISRYERGHVLPNAETVVSLAEALKIDTEVLLGGKASTVRYPAPQRISRSTEALIRDRDAVILLIDSVLARGDVE